MASGTNGRTVTVPSLAHLRSMTNGGVKGSPFDPWSHMRFFGAYSDGSVLDTKFDVRAVESMLDGTNAQATKNANTLALPVRSAPWEIKDGPGGKPEGDHARETLGRLAKPLLDRSTNGFWTRKTFHEIEWALDGQRPTIADLHWRPTASCERRLDAHGRPNGFFQRVPGDHPSQTDHPRWPGKVWIEPLRAFVYVHGRHRDPVHGTSELAVTFQLHELHRKLTFLLFQFLELNVVPRVLAYGDSITDAEANADELAATEGGGIVPWTRPTNGERPFDVLESGGHGAGMFLETLRWIEAQQSASILADFQILADQASGNGRGSHAMVADLRAWFESNLQAKADELAEQITEQVLRPLTVLAFGADAVVPSFSIGPVASSESDRALDMISSTITASTVNIPPGVVDALWIKLSRKLGLDVDQVRAAVEAWRAEQDTERPDRDGDDPTELADTITLAHGVATDVLAGVDPHDAIAQQLALARKVRTAAGVRRYSKPVGSPIGGGPPDTGGRSGDGPDAGGGAGAPRPASYAAPTPETYRDIVAAATADRAATDTEKRALSRYTGDGYRLINDHLRVDPGLSPGEHNLVRGYVDELMPLFDRYAAPMDVTVLRGVGEAGWLTTRDLTGQQIVNKGIVSTTFDPDVADDFADEVMFEVQVPRGFPAVPVAAVLGSDELNESELLLPHGTIFRVSSDAWEDAPAGRRRRIVARAERPTDETARRP